MADDPGPTGLRQALGLPAVMTSFADREFELRQGSIKRLLPGSMQSEGVCLALTGAWLKEKRSTTNGKLAAVQELFGKKRDFYSPDRNGAMQLAAVKAADPVQQKYEAADGSNTARLDGLLDGFGFRNDDRIADKVRGRIRPTPYPGTSTQHWDPASLLATATSAEFLPPGQGVCIALTAGKGGHVVAAYRSHGKHLHFFDPNPGVFKVRSVKEFFDAWVKRYEDGKMPISIDGDSDGSGVKVRTYSYVK